MHERPRESGVFGLAQSLLDSRLMPNLSTHRWATALRRVVFAGLLAGSLPGHARAEASPDPVAGARATQGQRHDAVAALEVSRQALATQSEALAAEIARLKASGSKPLLVGVGGRLAERLGQHQALVGQLAQLDRQVEAAKLAEAESRRTLVSALDTRIAELRGALGQGDAAAQRTRFEALRRLVEERGRLANAASPAPGRVVELPAVDPRRVDPAELQDLAAETRDQADHVRTALGQLEQRLGQLQSRRRMLRASAAFSRDESLFNEDERVRRVVSVRGDAMGTASARGVEGRPPSGEGELSGGGNSGPVATATGDTATRGDESPAAAPESDSNAPPPAAPGGAEFGSDSDGAQAGGADPSPAPVEPSPPVLAVPGGNAFDTAGSGVQPALIVQDSLDPRLLDTDVGGLGPDALAEQIRQLEQRKRALQKTVQQLDQRRRVLEREADDDGE
jgi:flagellar biosynthesis/type III secretory pathway chaperone